MHKDKAKKVFSHIKNTLADNELKGEINDSFSDIMDFYLDDTQKERVKNSSFIKKCFLIPAFILKKTFLKLSPVRRALFAISLALMITGGYSIGSDGPYTSHAIFGVIILLFILIMELMDKIKAKDELSAGHAVQKAFMPEKEPEVQGWSLYLYTQPANQVGGDMVDFLKLENNRYGITIADVAGKELGAALYMVKLQATLRTLADDTQSLSTLGAKINRIFYRDSAKNRFASMIYMEISSGHNSVRLINAGHFPPLLVRPDKITSLPKGSMAVGIKPDTRFNVQEFEMNTGDLLILYSDGLTESVNEKGEQFGEARLKSILHNLHNLKSSEAASHILGRVKAFQGKAKPVDDLSIVVVGKN